MRLAPSLFAPAPAPPTTAIAAGVTAPATGQPQQRRQHRRLQQNARSLVECYRGGRLLCRAHDASGYWKPICIQYFRAERDSRRGYRMVAIRRRNGLSKPLILASGAVNVG